MSSEELIAGLAQHEDARLHLALIALFLYEPGVETAVYPALSQPITHSLLNCFSIGLMPCREVALKGCLLEENGRFQNPYFSQYSIPDIKDISQLAVVGLES